MPASKKPKALKVRLDREENQLVIPLRGEWTPKALRAFKKALQEASSEYFAPAPVEVAPPKTPESVPREE